MVVIEILVLTYRPPRVTKTGYQNKPGSRLHHWLTPRCRCPLYKVAELSASTLCIHPNVRYDEKFGEFFSHLQ
jgi:hypothetical protein